MNLDISAERSSPAITDGKIYAAERFQRRSPVSLPREPNHAAKLALREVASSVDRFLGKHHSR